VDSGASVRILLERGWGKVAEYRPGDDAYLIDADLENEGGLRPRVTFSNAPTVSTVAEWSAKHGAPAKPPDPAMIEQLGIAPPAKVPVKVEENRLAPWKPAERWPRVGER
jgi:hypothetical protein